MSTINLEKGRTGILTRSGYASYFKISIQASLPEASHYFIQSNAIIIHYLSGEVLSSVLGWFGTVSVYSDWERWQV